MDIRILCIHLMHMCYIGGVASSVLAGEIPPEFHQGFVGCIDLVRIERRRLPLSKIAVATGTPFCEDDY